MKKIPFFLVCLCCVCAALGAARPVGSAAIKRGFYALKSGSIDGPIWVQADADGHVPPTIDRSLRLNESSEISIGGGALTITVGTPATVAFYQHRGDRAHTVFKEGGKLKTRGFLGQRGVKSMVGTYSFGGGELEVADVFYLAGAGLQEDVSCTFNQSGGTVSLTNTALNVTGPFPLTSSPRAVGIYNFSGGTINALCEVDDPERVGVRKGIGKGTFNWTGGVLNAKRMSESITNSGGRMSPGGEQTVGETLLIGKAPAVYLQQSKGVLSIDIAGRSRYDKLVWKNTSGNATVKLESGTVISINCLKDYKPTSGQTFQIISADRIEASRLLLEGKESRNFSYQIIESGPKTGLALVYTPGKGGGKLAE